MIEHVIFDCDDVLLDWIGGFRKYASKAVNRDISGEPQSWDMSTWIGEPAQVVSELIAEFNASADFGNLDATAGARSLVSDLEGLGVRLHVITSCSSDPSTVAMRRRNLEENFGSGTFDSIHCLDLGQPKISILRAFKEGAIWIEDNYKNALLGLEAGHRVFVRERPHNREYRHIDNRRLTWFKDWAELEGKF